MVLKKSLSQRLSIAYIFDGGHLFSRWPNVYSVRPLDNIKTNFKFEVDWGNGSKPVKIPLSQGLSIANIFKSSMAAISFLTDGPKSKRLFSR